MKARVIWGCPASGKSTYVEQHKGDNDIVYDYDRLMQALGGADPHKHNKNLGKIIWVIRQLLFKNLKDEQRIDTFWIITTFVDDAFKENFKEYADVKYILMDTSEEECIKRVEENDDRQATKEEQIKAIKEWFKKYNEQNKRKRLKLILDTCPH